MRQQRTNEKTLVLKKKRTDSRNQLPRHIYIARPPLVDSDTSATLTTQCTCSNSVFVKLHGPIIPSKLTLASHPIISSHTSRILPHRSVSPIAVPLPTPFAFLKSQARIQLHPAPLLLLPAQPSVYCQSVDNLAQISPSRAQSDCRLRPQPFLHHSLALYPQNNTSPIRLSSLLLSEPIPPTIQNHSIKINPCGLYLTRDLLLLAPNLCVLSSLGAI